MDIVARVRDVLQELVTLKKVGCTDVGVKDVEKLLNDLSVAGVVVVDKDKLTKGAGHIVVDELLGKGNKVDSILLAMTALKSSDVKKLGALPRWRCKSCRRIHKEYQPAVDCCK